MDIKEFITHLRTGGKATSDSFTLATGLSYVKTKKIVLAGGENSIKLIGITLDNEVEIESDVVLVDLKNYNDWQLV